MNKTEIERKFLVKKLPDLTGIEAEEQERNFLELGNNEKRITRIGDKYIYEEKAMKNGLSAEITTGIISKDEFEKLKQIAIGSLIRKNYILAKNISIKKYSGDFEGLIRAEFEFGSEEEAKIFGPPQWVGKEITGTDLGSDGKLVKLSKSEFLKILT